MPAPDSPRPMTARNQRCWIVASIAALTLAACQAPPVAGPGALPVAPRAIVEAGAADAGAADAVTVAVGARFEAAGCRNLLTAGVDENWRPEDVTFVRFSLFRTGTPTPIAGPIDVTGADLLGDPDFKVHFNHLRRGTTYVVEARAYNDADGAGPAIPAQISKDGLDVAEWKSTITVGDYDALAIDAGRLRLKLKAVHFDGVSQPPGVYNNWEGGCKAELNGAVTTVAGSATTGFVEGAVGTAAVLGAVSDLVRRSDGTVFAALWNRHVVVRITPARQVFQVAGSFGLAGFVSSTLGAQGCSKFDSRLQNPTGLALSPDENTLYIADGGNHRVVRVDLTSPDFGQLGAAADNDADYLEMYAGPDDGAVDAAPFDQATGFSDGPAATARFFMPSGLAMAGDGALIIVDRFNHAIRRHDGANVTTIAGGNGPSFIDDADGLAASFSNPIDIVNDGGQIVADGNWAFLITDHFNEAIRQLVPDGAGGWSVNTWYASDADGDPSDELLQPSGIANDARGRVWVGVSDSDFTTASVRMIDRAVLFQTDGNPRPNGPDLATRAWVSGMAVDFRDGAAPDARFKDGTSERFVPVIADPVGRIYFGDEGAGSVRLLN